MFDVSDILKHDTEVLNKEILLDIDKIEYDYNEITFKSPLIFKGNFHNINKILTVEGKVDICFDVNCYLCNEIFEYSQTIDIKEVFRQSPEDDEYEILSGKIDLNKAIIDNIILQLPTQLVCKQECKGICQVCGKNKNIEKCDCNYTKIDPRLEKLKDLL